VGASPPIITFISCCLSPTFSASCSATSLEPEIQDADLLSAQLFGEWISGLTTRRRE
jgi:hypothetical protein